VFCLREGEAPGLEILLNANDQAGAKEIMSYICQGEEWPRFDPITNRDLCRSCWGGNHENCGLLYSEFGNLKCLHWEETMRRGRDDGERGAIDKEYKKKCKCQFECDCIHLSEASFAQQEQQKNRADRKERRRIMREALEDESNPLAAVNPDWKPKEKKVHA
jgi:hypothetical protein